MRTAAMAAVALGLGLLTGCALSHQAGDGAGPGTDAAVPPDGTTPDSQPGPGPCPDERCGCIAGYRRCDVCEVPCPEGMSCHPTAQVCLPQDAARWSDNCLFRVDDAIDPDHLRLFGGKVCATGAPCAVEASDEGTSESPFGGICMPTAFCLALQDADPPMREPLACVYSGGTRLVDGPPPGECPSSDADAPFCGGVCGESRTCPEVPTPLVGTRIPPCVGVSDDRGFGVCSYSEERCREEDPVASRSVLDKCEDHYGARCACLVLRPEPPAAGADRGFAVLRSACRAYARHHGEHAECVSASWEPI